MKILKRLEGRKAIYLDFSKFSMLIGTTKNKRTKIFEMENDYIKGYFLILRKLLLGYSFKKSKR